METEAEKEEKGTGEYIVKRVGVGEWGLFVVAEGVITGKEYHFFLKGREQRAENLKKLKEGTKIKVINREIII